MNLKDIKPYLQYNPDTGIITVQSININNQSKHRKLIPDEEGMINTTVKIDTAVKSTKLKIKCNKLIWYLMYNKLPRVNQIVLHRNLDSEDYKLSNLCLVQKAEYYTLQESLKNLQGALKLHQHPTDIFSYVLEYRESGRLRREVVSDVVVARKKYSKLRFKFIKFIAKYVLTE